jgi:uncharacterized membrane protein HdeD (DUF308 family)
MRPVRFVSGPPPAIPPPSWSGHGVVEELSSGSEVTMIILGIVLLALGLITKIAVLWSLGILALVVGLVLLLLGSMGHAVFGRRHYF